MEILIIHQKIFQEFSRCANETSTKFIYTHFYTDLNEDQIFYGEFTIQEKRATFHTKKKTAMVKRIVVANSTRYFNIF